jgi:ABC-type taurine transport system ATPase subunit
MTVYDNLGFGLKRHKVKKNEIKTRVTSTAQMLGIEDLLKRKPSQLSRYPSPLRTGDPSCGPSVGSNAAA